MKRRGKIGNYKVFCVKPRKDLLRFSTFKFQLVSHAHTLQISSSVFTSDQIRNGEDNRLYLFTTSSSVDL
ncbi:hypothetical protein L1887_05856 [Cichorium endivia]|nr:hypothetical protein L1887_05856 [Cichorium endivia]